MIVVVEGPSAAGKTTWCRTHAEHWIPEPEPGPLGQALAAQRQRWREALAADVDGAVVALDGDPLKLWYSFAARELGDLDDEAWSDAVAATRADVAAGDLGFADLVLYADPGVDELRRRKEGDRTRTRRNFERHTAMRPSFRRWYEAVAELDPARVRWGHPATGLTDELLAVGPRRDRSDPTMLDAVLRSLGS